MAGEIKGRFDLVQQTAAVDTHMVIVPISFERRASELGIVMSVHQVQTERDVALRHRLQGVEIIFRNLKRLVRAITETDREHPIRIEMPS